MGGPVATSAGGTSGEDRDAAAEGDDNMDVGDDGGTVSDSKVADVVEQEEKDGGGDGAVPPPAPPSPAGPRYHPPKPRKDAFHVAEEWLASALFAGGLHPSVFRAVVQGVATAAAGVGDALLSHSEQAAAALAAAVCPDPTVDAVQLTPALEFVDCGPGGAAAALDNAIVASAGTKQRLLWKRLSPAVHVRACVLARVLCCAVV